MSDYDIVIQALIAGAMYKRREKEIPVNLPRYKCRCLKFLHCSFCNNKRWLPYNDALKIWNIDRLPLGLQLPQCHICTRFETDDNPLFPYSFLEKNDDFKFIYRCLKSHGHDHGMTFLDVQTGLEVYC